MYACRRRRVFIFFTINFFFLQVKYVPQVASKQLAVTVAGGDDELIWKKKKEKKIDELYIYLPHSETVSVRIYRRQRELGVTATVVKLYEALSI